jgi:hypothetical protein
MGHMDVRLGINFNVSLFRWLFALWRARRLKGLHFGITDSSEDGFRTGISELMNVLRMADEDFVSRSNGGSEERQHQIWPQRWLIT